MDGRFVDSLLQVVQGVVQTHHFHQVGRIFADYLYQSPTILMDLYP